MNRQDVLDIGFKEIPHFTVTNALIYKLPRRRHISIGCVGDPNEMMWICQVDDKDDKKITDLICLHNYDHDGYMTKIKLQNLILALTQLNQK